MLAAAAILSVACGQGSDGGTDGGVGGDSSWDGGDGDGSGGDGSADQAFGQDVFYPTPAEEQPPPWPEGPIVAEGEEVQYTMELNGFERVDQGLRAAFSGSEYALVLS